VVQAGISLLIAQLELVTALGGTSDQRCQLRGGIDSLSEEADILQKKLTRAATEMRLDDIGVLAGHCAKLQGRTQEMLSSVWDLCGGINEWNDSRQTTFLHSTTVACDDWLTSLTKRTDVDDRSREGWTLRKLLIKKVALLRFETVERDATTRVGLSAPSHLANLRYELVCAELDLCDSTEQRISLCAQHVDCLKRLVKLAEAEHRHRGLPGYEVTLTRIRMLDAEILLERQRMQANSPKVPAGDDAP
jgi:hypothetical protein